MLAIFSGSAIPKGSLLGTKLSKDLMVVVFPTPPGPAPTINEAPRET